jgi:hypothetical protein
MLMSTPRMIWVWPKFLVTSRSDSEGGLIDGLSR